MPRFCRKRLAFGGALSLLSIGQPLFSQSPVQQAGGVPGVGHTPAASIGQATLMQRTFGEELPQLQNYGVPNEMAGAVAARLQLAYAADPRVRIFAQPGNSAVMVFGTPTIQADVQHRLKALSEEIARTGGIGDSEGLQERSYQLRNLSAQGLEQKLLELLGSQVISEQMDQGNVRRMRLRTERGYQNLLQIDYRNSDVTLKGTPSTIHGWLLVVSAIDNGATDSNSPTQVVPLGHADPNKVEKALRVIQASYQPPINPNLQDPNLEPMDPQTTDATTFGQPQVAPGQDPTSTAVGSLEEIGADSGLFGDVQIEFVGELGLVIVKGAKRDVQRVLEVIERIKKQSEETQPEVEVYPLEHVNSQALSTIIRELYDQVLAPRQGQVSITALNQPNSLLLIGRKEAVASVIELLKKLDKPLDPSSRLQVFRLVHAAAADAEQTVRSFFVEKPGSGETDRTGLGTRVRVVADNRTNSLIIEASPRDLIEVARLIEQIDVEGAEAQSEIRVFELQNALSDEIAPILQSAITGQAAATGNAQGGNAAGGNAATNNSSGSAPTGRLAILAAESGTMINSGILQGVTITSNPGINSLVVRAPSGSMPLIAALIEQLDRSSNASAQVKVFEIRNGDATSLASTIQQLFGIAATTAGNLGAGGAAGQNNTVNLGVLTGASEGAIVPVRITVDTRTNSIIVSGSEGDLEVIEALLLRLDEDGVRNRLTEVVWLRNSDATQVATAINGFIQQQRQILQQASQQNNFVLIPRAELIDREVLVQAEATTNSLIISASPRYANVIREVIERLDRQPPMIHVQILLAEVTLDDTFEWGSELGLQDSLLFDRGTASGGTLGTPGFNVTDTLDNGITAGKPENLAAQGLSGFGLGRSNSTLGYGGLVLSAASESVSILIRALQDAQRLQILSRPQVMTLDNLEAFVQVGQRVPRITGVTAGNGVTGQTIATNDVDVGLLMRVRPRTNQDGLIHMDVYVERSSVGDETTGIPVGFGPNGEVIRSPVINTTNALTKVTAQDGQTVVFAGLITKERASISRRVPWLSDIPILGALFRYDTESERRTELLVVMTPRIVRGPEDTQIINQVESSRMSWCLADVLNIHGDASLSEGNGLWGPAASPVIYPHVNPLGTDEGLIPGQTAPYPNPLPASSSEPMGRGTLRGSMGAPWQGQSVLVPEGTMTVPPNAVFQGPVGVSNGSMQPVERRVIEYAEVPGGVSGQVPVGNPGAAIESSIPTPGFQGPATVVPAPPVPNFGPIPQPGPSAGPVNANVTPGSLQPRGIPVQPGRP
jgi:type II secretion system protein D